MIMVYSTLTQTQNKNIRLLFVRHFVLFFLAAFRFYYFFISFCILPIQSVYCTIVIIVGYWKQRGGGGLEELWRAMGGAVHDMMTWCSGMCPVCSPEETLQFQKSSSCSRICVLECPFLFLLCSVRKSLIWVSFVFLCLCVWQSWWGLG